MSFADRNVRLDNSDLLNFLARQSLASGDIFEIKADEDLDNLDMARLGDRYDFFPRQNIEVSTWVRRTYELYCNRQLYISFPIVMPVINHLDLEISGVLGVSTTASPEQRSDIVAAFLDYNESIHGSLDKYVEEKLAEAGISSDLFRLACDYRFLWQRREVDLTLHDALMENYEQEWRAFIPEMRGKDITLSLHPVHDEFFAFYSPVSSPNQIDLPDGIPRSEVEDIIVKRALDDASRNDCPSVDPEKVLIKEFSWVPATSVSWSWVRSRIGHCKFHFWRQKTQHRKQVYCLYATATFKKPDERFRRIINECLREASTAAVLALVLTDLSTAITTFRDKFFELFQQKIGETLDCMIASLYFAVEPRGDWYPP